MEARQPRGTRPGSADPAPNRLDFRRPRFMRLPQCHRPSGPARIAVTATRQMTAGGQLPDDDSGACRAKSRRSANRLNKGDVGAQTCTTGSVVQSPPGSSDDTKRSIAMRVILTAALALAPLMAKDSEPFKRLDEAAAVLSEVMSAPDKG